LIQDKYGYNSSWI